MIHQKPVHIFSLSLVIKNGNLGKRRKWKRIKDGCENWENSKGLKLQGALFLPVQIFPFLLKPALHVQT